MKFGISVLPFEQFFDVRRLAALARDAEDAGWDGVFLWDHVLIWPTPIADPWVALACMALATERVKLGPLVTPLPRRRPVKLARECVTLDHLSRGAARAWRGQRRRAVGVRLPRRRTRPHATCADARGVGGAAYSQ